MKIRILWLDDQPRGIKHLVDSITVRLPVDVNVELAQTIEDAVALIWEHNYDLVITDMLLPLYEAASMDKKYPRSIVEILEECEHAPHNGIAIVKILRSSSYTKHHNLMRPTPIIVLTVAINLPVELEAIEHIHIINKSLSPEELLSLIETIILRKGELD